MASDLAARMKVFLTRAGLSQGEMAQRLGLSDPAVSHWMSGRQQPTHENLLRFVTECGSDLPTFYGLKLRAAKRRRRTA